MSVCPRQLDIYAPRSHNEPLFRPADPEGATLMSGPAFNPFAVNPLRVNPREITEPNFNPPPPRPALHPVRGNPAQGKPPRDSRADLPPRRRAARVERRAAVDAEDALPRSEGRSPGADGRRLAQGLPRLPHPAQ